MNFWELNTKLSFDHKTVAHEKRKQNVNISFGLFLLVGKMFEFYNLSDQKIKLHENVNSCRYDLLVQKLLAAFSRLVLKEILRCTLRQNAR